MSRRLIPLVGGVAQSLSARPDHRSRYAAMQQSKPLRRDRKHAPKTVMLKFSTGKIGICTFLMRKLPP
ncbi:hypothetical protein DT23_01840 [Thioclava indica]|uniref:Uncharacterized protein n=1 Tax=Thioclava indica TaxID=1353528 RepID=A0A074JZ31_9RHOB|nr:hypothetical protein DT23_01840 [Thioclava indica]